MRPTTQVTGKENDMIKARIDGVELKISEREPLLAGTVGLNKISLIFSDEWAIFTKQIDFTNEQSGETRRISAEVGVCTVPWELLKDEGDITCYVRGIGSDGRLVLRTNEANLGTVLGSTDGNVPGTGTPTPDACDETAAKIGDLSKLETNDKSQLVAAINELKSGTAVTEATVSGWGFTKNTGSYSKPTGGIPKTDLASAVQTSLGKADSALQTVPSTYRTASAQDSIDSGKVDKVTGKGLSTNDYTAAAKAKVDAIPASPKYTDTVYDDTAVKSRLAAVEGMETVALTVASGRLTNASYTARYSSLLGMVFVRIYGTVNADMNTGYDYDIMNIGARLPNSHAALAVKSSKAAQAFAKSSGVISLRPLESGIKNYDVYITGFWFA